MLATCPRKWFSDNVLRCVAAAGSCVPSGRNGFLPFSRTPGRRRLPDALARLVREKGPCGVAAGASPHGGRSPQRSPCSQQPKRSQHGSHQEQEQREGDDAAHRSDGPDTSKAGHNLPKSRVKTANTSAANAVNARPTRIRRKMFMVFPLLLRRSHDNGLDGNCQRPACAASRQGRRYRGGLSPGEPAG